MQFSILGYSVKKIMELDLDVKDVTILRYFDDFRKSSKMNYEVIEGIKYYWISYQKIENELPFLGLGKSSIMMRMLKLRDLGVLSHYTKKECGTFSYYALGERYKELLYMKNNNFNSNKDNNKFRGGQTTNFYNDNKSSIEGQDYYEEESYYNEEKNININNSTSSRESYFIAINFNENINSKL